MKTSSVFASLLLFGLVIGCRKPNEPEPVAPDAVASFQRSFHYKDTDTWDNANWHTDSNDIDVSSFTDFRDRRLTFVIYGVGLDNRDDIRFAMDSADVVRGPGRYVIERGSTVNRVDVTYGYSLGVPKGSAGGNIYFPGSAVGVVTITRYDGRTHVIDGSMDVLIESDRDPATWVFGEFRQTDIRVVCAFKNMPVPR